MSPGADRDEDGNYVETYPTEEFLEALGEGEEGTQHVADVVGCSYPTAYKKLNNLAEEGEVEKRKVADTILWSRDG
jgi:predicted transcriptional regulator